MISVSSSQSSHRYLPIKKLEEGHTFELVAVIVDIEEEEVLLAINEVAEDKWREHAQHQLAALIVAESPIFCECKETSAVTATNLATGIKSPLRISKV